MFKTSKLLDVLNSYHSGSDWELYLHSCFFCLYSCLPEEQLKLPTLLILRNVKKILVRYEIEIDIEDQCYIDGNQLKELRLLLLEIDKNDDLMLDGRHFLSALDGLSKARNYMSDQLIQTSSCVYSVNHIIRSAASHMWINQFHLDYEKWESGKNIPLDNFYLNNDECVKIIRSEWGFVSKWFLDNKQLINLSDETIESVNNDFAIWKKNEFLLLRKQREAGSSRDNRG